MHLICHNLPHRSQVFFLGIPCFLNLLSLSTLLSFLNISVPYFNKNTYESCSESNQDILFPDIGEFIINLSKCRIPSKSKLISFPPIPSPVHPVRHLKLPELWFIMTKSFMTYPHVQPSNILKNSLQTCEPKPPFSF